MSLAFSLSATLVWYYLVRSGNFTGVGFEKPLLFSIPIELPWFWRDFFQSLASIVFVPDVFVGILLAVVLLFISRIGLMLALMGWSICFGLLQFSAMGSTYGMFFPGFNLILISIAIGSIYLIPSKTSYLLAALGTVIGFVFAYALSGRYYYPDVMPARPGVLFVPMFALPMNVVVISLIYSLRLRLRQRVAVINDYGILHPEKALEAYISRYQRFSSAGVPQIHLPINGEWIITQSHNGPHTHQLDWAYAWDFEMEDRFGKKYLEHEHDLKDYYCFGKPVLAAAAGYVVKVVNSIPDNPIGSINTQDNWGNYVTLSHGYGFYTLYAHLREGSVKLAEGDYVKLGDKLGMVGNSGRSAVPHLHFQAQSGVDAGSPTIFSHIVNYKRQTGDGGYELCSSGVPLEGEVVSALIPEKDLAPILQFGYRQKQRYAVQTPYKEWQETWQVDLDLVGTHSLVSDHGSRLEFSIYNGIYNSLKLAHGRKTALAAFALVASRLPWNEGGKLTWKDEPSLSVLMGPFWKNVTLFLIPFFRPIRVSAKAELKQQNQKIIVESVTSLSVLGIVIKKLEGNLTLSRKEGIIDFSLRQNSQTLLSAQRMELEEIEEQS
jgi:murein DD-endopeptidase MepM/ murein hydrolase activator NlpD